MQHTSKQVIDTSLGQINRVVTSNHRQYNIEEGGEQLWVRDQIKIPTKDTK